MRAPHWPQVVGPWCPDGWRRPDTTAILLCGAMTRIRAIGTPFLVGRLRLTTGLVLFCYVATHDLNHMLGIVSLEVMEEAQYWFVSFWQFLPCALVLYASLALQPPYLQDLMDYPVVTAGLVMGPRGIGTMAAMMIVGRLVGRVDIRLLLAVGLGLTAWSFYAMTGWTPAVDAVVSISKLVLATCEGETFSAACPNAQVSPVSSPAQLSWTVEL